MTPTTWAETMERFARVLTPHDAQEWLRQALRATWNVDDVADLNRAGRALALQRVLGVIYALEEEGDLLVFRPDGGRDVIVRTFARRWNGIALAGPPWRLGPGEPDRPTFNDWAAAAAAGF